MHSQMWIIIFTCLVGTSFSSFRTGFYKPGPGLHRDTWIKSSGESIPYFSKLGGYPDCPTGIINENKFEWQLASTSLWHHFRYQAYFVPTLSGVHRLIVACREDCVVDFELQPGVLVTVKHTDTVSSTIGWTYNQRSDGLLLKKGFRYKIDVRYSDGLESPYFMKLGMLFPDGTEVKPLDERYLRRSMEFYSFNGLLTEYYASTSYPAQKTQQAFADANPAKYPNNPTSVFCRASLYEQSNNNFAGTYGRRYTGYLTVPKNGSYQLKAACNSFCEINVTTTNNTVKRVFAETSPETEHSIGTYFKHAYYPIEILHVDGGGDDYVRVQRREGSTGNFEKDLTGSLKNLLPQDTFLYIPVPILSMENSSALSAELLASPTVPPADQWTASNAFEIVYHETLDSSSKVTVAFTGSLPVKKTFTGLKKYTEYSFYAHYYGFVQSTIEHNIISAKRTIRTDEDVPEDYPPSFTATTTSSTSIQVSFGPLPSSAKRNGVITGYTVKYKVKEASTWLYDTGTSRYRTIGSLQKYAIYELHVAASTSKGVGVYSPVIERRTAEDTPSSPPSNITGYNTSSTSLKFEWADVPEEHRNGIITGYKVYIKTSTGSWQSPVSTTDKFYERIGLAYWTLYDVKLSAETSVGEGVKSAVLSLRTDEDRPGGPPRNLVATAVNSNSIRFEWSDIQPSLQNGIILSYEVKYQRKDKCDDLKTSHSTSQATLLSGLDKYIEYDMSVAGVTGKGVGIFSATITERTIGDVPSEAPTGVGGGFVSATKIYATWGAIPAQGRNGIISQYKITYRKKDSGEDWKSTNVSSSDFRVEIGDLQYYTLYAVKVAGVTNHGTGPFSEAVYIRTDAYANSFTLETPTAFVTNMKFRNKALLRHVSKRAAVRSVEDCFQICRQCSLKGSGCKCASINIKTTESASLVCEISKNNMKTFPNDFVSSEGSQYYEVC